MSNNKLLKYRKCKTKTNIRAFWMKRVNLCLRIYILTSFGSFVDFYFVVFIVYFSCWSVR